MPNAVVVALGHCHECSFPLRQPRNTFRRETTNSATRDTCLFVSGRAAHSYNMMRLTYSTQPLHRLRRKLVAATLIAVATLTGCILYLLANPNLQSLLRETEPAPPAGTVAADACVIVVLVVVLFGAITRALALHSRIRMGLLDLEREPA